MKSLSASEHAPHDYRAPSWELIVRYLAAYACIFIAIAAAWTSMRSPFGPTLVILTAIGLPISLRLRRNNLMWRGRPINRLMLSSIVVGLTTILSFSYLTTNLAGFGLSVGGLLNALIAFSANRSVELMMGVFLIFGVCRCLFILTDKDALLCAVPSFAVLLLLIVVQREPGVVISFLAWALMTAVLLALDHRRESRRTLSGYVAAVVPGQDVRLSARSLAGIMAISLTGAVALSYTLAVSSSDSRSAFEEFLRFVTGGLSRISNENQVSDESTAPEVTQQNLVDYRSAPPLPTRTALWQMRAAVVRPAEENDSSRPTRQGRNGQRYLTQEVFPTYWKLSNLGRYDGASWIPSPGLSTLKSIQGYSEKWFSAALGYELVPGGKWRAESSRALQIERETRGAVRATRGERVPSLLFFPKGNVRRIGQRIQPLLATRGLVPVLPEPQVLYKDTDRANIVRANAEGAASIGLLRANTFFQVVSNVPDISEYTGLPQEKDAKPQPNVRMSVKERAIYLQLPEKLPARLKELAKNVGGSWRDPLARAHALERWVQTHATYTLRPPSLPDDRDATDFFLFDSRRGYCTHFAGALAVLCRLNNIPSRLATGFANPERVEEEGSTLSVARSANAHAWTEVWIDGFGWIPLDATPPDDRGDNVPTLWGDLGDRFSSAVASVWLSMQTHRLLWLGGGTLGLALLFSTALVGNRMRERRFWLSRAKKLFTRPITVGGKRGTTENFAEASRREAEDIAARAAILSAYNQVSKQLGRRYHVRPEWQTPHDWFQEACEALPQYDLKPIQTLVDLHSRAMYDPRYLTEEDRDLARNALKSLSWKKKPLPKVPTSNLQMNTGSGQ